MKAHPMSTCFPISILCPQIQTPQHLVEKLLLGRCKHLPKTSTFGRNALHGPLRPAFAPHPGRRLNCEYYREPVGIGPIEPGRQRRFGGDRLDMRPATVRTLWTVARGSGPIARRSRKRRETRVVVSWAAPPARFPIGEALMCDRTATDDSLGTPEMIWGVSLIPVPSSAGDNRPYISNLAGNLAGAPRFPLRDFAKGGSV